MVHHDALIAFGLLVHSRIGPSPGRRWDSMSRTRTRTTDRVLETFGVAKKSVNAEYGACLPPSPGVQLFAEMLRTQRMRSSGTAAARCKCRT